MDTQGQRRFEGGTSNAVFENQLISQFRWGGLSRRDFLRTAVFAGMSLPAAAALLDACGTSATVTNSTTVPQVDVRWGNLPYWDTCTFPAIALAQGWLKSVGITLNPSPNGINLNSADDAVAIYASGREDVMQFPGSGFLPAAKTIPPYKMFAVTSIFIGYAVMAQPNAGYKSYQELVANGMPKDQALVQAIDQIKGKRYAYPSDPNVRQFLNLILARGNLSLSDIVSLVNPDAQNVALMQAGRADFQSGGGPSRLTLAKAGFKAIVTSGDLAATAQTSVTSPELSAVLYNGLTASQSWFDANHDTALRLASVNFRINQQINDHPELTTPHHVPYLNSIAGTNFTEADAAVAYSQLDPFPTWDQQKAIFDDSSNPLNLQYVFGAAIKSYEKQGVFKSGQFKVSDFTNANSIYDEMANLRTQTEQSMKDATNAILASSGSSKVKAEQLLGQAQLYYEWFDYLDSARTAKAAVSAAKS